MATSNGLSALALDTLTGLEDLAELPEGKWPDQVIKVLKSIDSTEKKQISKLAVKEDVKSLAPSQVKPVEIDKSNAALFEELDLKPGANLSSDEFNSVIQKLSDIATQQSSKGLSADSSAIGAFLFPSFPFLTLGFDPFVSGGELEVYLDTIDSSPTSNDPFPTDLIFTFSPVLDPVPGPVIPPLFGDSFINGRDSVLTEGLDADLQANTVTDLNTDVTFNLQPGQYNHVAGSGADDTMRGNDGDNILYGFGGDDTIKGSGGSDYIQGGAGYDTVDYTDSGAAISVGQFGRITKSTGGVDTLLGDANAPFVPTIQKIVGDASQVNEINVIGAPGAIEADLNAGFLNVLSIGASFDIENFVNVFGGNGDDTIVGDDEDNILASGLLPNSTGATDNDWLIGGGGDDTYIGGTGRDTLTGGEGGEGVDTFVLGRNGEDYYLDDSSLFGTDEFAVVRNFEPGIDKIDVDGNPPLLDDYLFVGGIFILRDNGIPGLDSEDDLIAVVPSGFNPETDVM